MEKTYTPGTLDDKIMKDGLSAVATLVDSIATKDTYFVVGGMATQSYLPSSCRRPTSDIDLAVLFPLNREGFRIYSKSIKEYLSDNGYHVSDGKFRRAFSVDFQDKNSNAAFISIPRHNKKSFLNIEEILQRERKNARLKIIEGTTDTYVVASPEDIVVRKLARAVNRLFRNPNFEQYVNSMKVLKREDIESKIAYLNSIRGRVFATESLGVKLPNEGEEFLRFLSDLFDIRILSELGGLNRNYFNEAFKSWNALIGNRAVDEEDSWRIGLVTRAVLPDELITRNIPVYH